MRLELTRVYNLNDFQLVMGLYRGPPIFSLECVYLSLLYPSFVSFCHCVCVQALEWFWISVTVIFPLCVCECVSWGFFCVCMCGSAV